MNKTSIRQLVVVAVLISSLIGCGQAKQQNVPQTKTAQQAAPAAQPQHAIPITATSEDYCRILFSAGGDDSITGGLYCVGSDGKGFKRLAKCWVKSPARLSPNGKRYVFQSYSKEFKDECNAVYDSERDTLFFIKEPDYAGLGAVGWYPRWWDDDHIYYRIAGFVFKQNIHTGASEKITKHKISNWLDPIWVPELNKFVNVEKKRICTFNVDGSGYRGDSLQMCHYSEYSPFLIKANGQFLVGYETGNRFGFRKAGQDSLDYFVLIDLNGEVVYKKVLNILDHGSLASCDQEGKWFYYLEMKESGGQRIETIFRQLIADTARTETIYYNSSKNWTGIIDLTIISGK